MKNENNPNNKSVAEKKTWISIFWWLY